MKLLIQVAADAAWNYDLVILVIFFTCQVSACELQPFSCHDLANDIHSQTAKTVFSHLKWNTKITTYRDVYTRDDSQRQF